MSNQKNPQIRVRMDVVMDDSSTQIIDTTIDGGADSTAIIQILADIAKGSAKPEKAVNDTVPAKETKKPDECVKRPTEVKDNAIGGGYPYLADVSMTNSRRILVGFREMSLFRSYDKLCISGVVYDSKGLKKTKTVTLNGQRSVKESIRNVYLWRCEMSNSTPQATEMDVEIAAVSAINQIRFWGYDNHAFVPEYELNNMSRRYIRSGWDHIGSTDNSQPLPIKAASRFN